MPPLTAKPAAPLAVAVVWDETQRREANRQKRNYWYSYIWEILDRLGVTASAVAPSALAEPGRLARFGSLILGGTPFRKVPREATAVLEQWLRGGGTLIGFAPEELDEIFGGRASRKVPQPADAFAITGYLELARAPLTQGIHSLLRPDQRLIIISPVRPVTPVRSRQVARFFKPNPSARDDGSRARATGLAVVTARRLGRGQAFYFGFDLPRTMWAIQQGRPVDADHDGDGYLRFGDAMVIGKNSPEVAYADELLFLLRSMLARKPLPMVHQLPATDGDVPDALFYFGGDDECQPGIQVSTSNFMKSRGLPYHINLMLFQGRFGITRREYRRIRANGHEASLHYNFMDGFSHPGGFSKRDVLRQNALYRKAFGRPPVCTVNHWCRWCGWAEPAKWMLAAGGKADNSRIHWPWPPLNPVNRLGFAFGTGFPYFFRDDWRGANARIPFLQEPIVAYEVGYEGNRTDLCMIRRAVNTAARHHMTMNMFYHPTYLHHNAACRRAIDGLLRYIRARKVRPVFMGNDELWRWWWERSTARTRGAQMHETGVRFTANCRYTGGFVVKVPLGNRRVRACLVDGKRARQHVERRFGQNWAMVPLGPGRHDVAVEWSSAT